MKVLSLVSLVISLVALAIAVRLTSLSRESDLWRRSLSEAGQKIHVLESQLVAASARIEVLEKRPLAEKPALPMTAQSTRNSLPILTEGTYSNESDAIVYGPDAKLRIATDVVASSPSGVMVSDRNQKMVVGDLRLENSSSVIEATGAVVDVEKHRFSAKSMTLTPKNPSPPPEPTSVAPAAAREPRGP